MRSPLIVWIAGLGLVLTLAVSAEAGEFTFTTIADNTGPFKDFSQDPAINNAGQVVFVATYDAATTKEMLVGSGGPLTVIASTASGFVAFGSPPNPSISNLGRVAFEGQSGADGLGIFSGDGGPVTTVASALGLFGTVFDPPGINDGPLVAFHGKPKSSSGLGAEGIFTGTSETAPFIVIANKDDGFKAFFNRVSINNAGTVVFLASLTTGGAGVFAGDGTGPVTTVADTLGPFSGFTTPSINDSGVAAFRADFDSGGQAILATDGTTSTTIADTSGPYASFFDTASINNGGVVVFAATLDAGGRGIFTGPDPVADRVIATGDPLLSSTVADVHMHAESINDLVEVAFWARLADGTQGIFRGESNQPPLCDIDGPYTGECQGLVTTVALDGSASGDPDGDPVTFAWTTDCPGGEFDDPSSPTPTLTLDSSCPDLPVCTVTLTVTDDKGLSDTCSTTVTVEDTTPPTLTIDATPITVEDADCSGDEAVTLPTPTAEDDCGEVTIDNDAPAAFPAGQTTAVTFTATDQCGNASTETIDVTVLYGANILVRAAMHIVGSGSHPGSTKEPLVGLEVCAYDKSDDSCARTVCGGISHHHYQCIVDTCEPVNCATTDANGEAVIDLPPGDYLIIAADATKTVLPDPLGVSAGDLQCGQLMVKHLQQIVKADGKKVPGKTTRRTGSELLIIEPEYVVWDNTQQLYPFVFESVSDWGVSVSVTPPEGFVADYGSLSEDVDNELEAVQFTIAEVGSDLVPTQTMFVVTHKGRREIIRSSVGILLTPDYARSRGFSVPQLRAKGLIVDPLGRSEAAPLKRP